MAQLIMRWKNDGTEATNPVLPSNVSVITYPELPDAMQVWLDIVQYMSNEGIMEVDEAYYKRLMTDWPHYNEDKCFFVTIDGAPAATITVICDYDTQEGYIHMVSCKPDFRGMGLGYILNSIALYILKREGMQTAHLTTDDWRIPAIKTYLKAGFEPDLDTEADFKERWDKIYSIIGL